MSDEPRVVGATGIAVGSASAVAVPAATFVPTGRHIEGSDDCWAQVQAWAQLEDLGKITLHPLNQALTVALAGAEPFREPELKCYRGRYIEESSVPAPTPNDMGPPPSNGGNLKGRYNHDDQPVLYLSRSIEGIARELPHDPERVVWVQSYTLKLECLRIADLRPPVQPLLNHVFWWTEMASKERGTGFLFSQFVAGRVAALFDGMIVPGVRGDASVRYDNVVIFRPQARWPSWLTGGSLPWRLQM